MNRAESAALISALQATFEALNALASESMPLQRRREKVLRCTDTIARAKTVLMSGDTD
jgi:hypothetical protein